MQISEYLDHELRAFARVRDLEALADEVAQRPTDAVLRDLRTVLAQRPLSGEDSRRLNVLLSQLYHASATVDRRLVDQLRGEVSTAWELARSRALLGGRR